MNRREFLQTTAATAVLAALPVPVHAIAPAIAAPPVLTPMWAVGSPGKWNWQPIAADTLEEAIRIYAEDNGYINEDDEIETELDGQRCKSWDAKDHILPADWLREGIGHHCDRCGYETDPFSGGRAVGDEAICEDCLTIADWQVIDPEYAAELLENLKS